MLLDTQKKDARMNNDNDASMLELVWFGAPFLLPILFGVLFYIATN